MTQNMLWLGIDPSLERPIRIHTETYKVSLRCEDDDDKVNFRIFASIRSQKPPRKKKEEQLKSNYVSYMKLLFVSRKPKRCSNFIAHYQSEKNGDRLF